MKRFLPILVAALLLAAVILPGCSTAPSPSATAQPTASANPGPSSTSPTSSPASTASPTSTAAAGKTWNLKLSHEQPPDSYYQLYGHIPFAQAIEKATNGRVKVTIYDSSTLMKSLSLSPQRGL